MALSEVLPWLTDAALKAPLLLGLGLLVDRCLRRTSARLRHGVLALAVGGTLVLPFLTLATPGWGVALQS